ncbi:MAG: choice-of-anchor Q domain-containing protein [Saprospiraceae bacterium]
MQKVFILLFFLTFQLTIYSQTRYHVKTGGNSNLGTSWATAVNNIQQAVDKTVDGDTIWVAVGTYNPTKDNTGNSNPADLKTRTIYIKKNITILGGFVGDEVSHDQRNWEVNQTILSGDNGNFYQVVYIDGCGVTNITNDCVIDGFIIEGGAATIAFPHNTGGGIYINGMGSGNFAKPTISHCIFRNNAANSGSAIFNDGFGGEASPNISDCLFYDNLISDALHNNAFAGISSPLVVNCTFVDNVGEAMFNDGRSGGTSNPTIHNCIFWNNNIVNLEATGNAHRSSYPLAVLPVGMTAELISFSTDPLFADAANDNFRLTVNSPVINGGANNFNPNVVDLANKPRVEGLIIDMGAYEFPVCGRIFVDSSQTSASQLGTSWATAYTNLDNAIATAHACDIVSEIWMAKGTYLPATDKTGNASPGEPRDKTFYISKELKIYGGFAGGETTLAQRDVLNNKTILSGDLNNDDVAGIPTAQLRSHSSRADNAFNVVHIDATADNTIISNSCEIDGLYIQDGNGANGAGIFNEAEKSFPSTGNESSPIIRNCHFQRNASASDGGAIYNRGIGANVLTVIDYCSFDKNSGRDGGAISNYAKSDGDASVTITNCTFYNNESTSDGGAIRNVGEDFSIFSNTKCNPFISHCEFVQNVAVNIGGAISNASLSGGEVMPIIDNSIFFLNSGIRGGAMGGSGMSCHMFVDNCSFAKNSGSAGGSVSFNSAPSSTFNNSIFWDNTGGFPFQSSGGTNAVINFCIYDDGNPNGTVVFVGAATGSNNIDFDPLFIDATHVNTFNLRLAENSPAINGGQPFFTSLGSDLAGNPRIAQDTVDMGAYEFDPCPITKSIIADIGTSASENIIIETSMSITANNSILNNSIVTYDAGTAINFNIGFEVTLGSIFEAKIGGCGVVMTLLSEVYE